MLIVDDDRDTVMTLGILLRSEGFQVRLAQGGSAVPKAVAEFGPDAVLLDLRMPDRHGLELARELKQQYGASCPVLIAITAHSGDLHRQATEASGFSHHVSKPYEPDSLLTLLASLNRRP